MCLYHLKCCKEFSVGWGSLRTVSMCTETHRNGNYYMTNIHSVVYKGCIKAHCTLIVSHNTYSAVFLKKEDPSRIFCSIQPALTSSQSAYHMLRNNVIIHICAKFLREEQMTENIVTYVFNMFVLHAFS